MKKLIFALFFLVGAAACASAQGCATISYGAEDGLGESGYTDIFQDSRGFLWVGSYSGGVNRFDGKHWKNYNIKDGLTYHTVENIFEDAEGFIWLLNNNLNRYIIFSLESEQFLKIEPDTKALDNNTFYDRFQKKVFRVGDYPQLALFVFDYATLQFIPTGTQLMDSNTSSHYTKFEHIWSDYFKHRYIIRLVNDSTHAHDTYEWMSGVLSPIILQKNTALDTKYLGLLNNRDGRGILYALYKENLYTYQSEKWEQHPYPHLSDRYGSQPNPIVLEKPILWDFNPSNGTFVSIYSIVGDKRFLICDYDAQTLRVLRTTIYESSSLPHHIFCDKAGTYWISTESEVLRVLPYQMQLPKDAPGMMPETWCVVQSPSDGAIWLASYMKGLARFDGAFMHPQPKGMFVGKYIDGSFVYDGKMLFNLQSQELQKGNSCGLLAFDGKDKWTLHHKGIIGFFFNQNKKGELMRGTHDAGLWILPKGASIGDEAAWRKIDKQKGLQLTNVLTTLEDRYGRYWMGRPSQGIALYDPRRDSVFNWSPEDNPQTRSALSMAEDAHGNLWLGCKEGLFFLENKDSLLTSRSNLAALLQPIAEQLIGKSTVTICKVVEGGHTLLLGNSTGYHLLDLEAFYATPRRVEFRGSFQTKYDNYRSGVPIQNGVWIDRDSNMWIVSNRGVICQKSKIFIADTIRPAAFIKKVSVGKDKNFVAEQLQKTIELESTERSVTIHFGMSNNPMLYNNVLFRYRLSGDSSWSELTDREFITYQNLGYGSYVFELQAIKNGIESRTESVSFSISRPLLQTWWFWLLFFVALSAIVLYLVQRRNYFLIKVKENELIIEKNKVTVEVMSKEKTKLQIYAIINQLNPHFINNALQWLQIRVDDDEEAVSVVGKLSENIGTVFKNSRNKQSYHALMSELHLTENYLHIQQARFGKSLSIVTPSALAIHSLAEIKVPLMIVQIHVENAVEHGIRNKSDGAGTVKIYLENGEDCVRIIVEDDGVGRAAAEKIASKGTQNGTKMLSELEAIYNNINSMKISQIYTDNIFKDAAGDGYGTRVTITIPKVFDYDID